MRASHSSCIVLRVAGILVALGGFGFTIGGVFTSIKSSIFISLPLIGSQPFSVIYFSIIRFSKIAPENGDTTAMSGTSFDFMYISAARHEEQSLVVVLAFQIHSDQHHNTNGTIRP
uniref:Uncharacterized protein n=1 Tax=Glossina austeni TaxID=7395 RepID=A0A1A9URA3_GLOAU